MPARPHPTTVYTYQKSFIGPEKLNELGIQLRALEESTPDTTTGKAKVTPRFRAIVGVDSPRTGGSLDRHGAGSDGHRPGGSHHRARAERGREPDTAVDPTGRVRAAATSYARMQTFYGLIDVVEKAPSALAGNGQPHPQVRIANDAVSALLAWNRGNDEMASGVYTSAIVSYGACRRYTLSYLKKRHEAQDAVTYQRPEDPNVAAARSPTSVESVAVYWAASRLHPACASCRRVTTSASEVWVKSS